VQGEAESHATKAGMLVGTYTCMAPEQVLGEPIDQRTDVYALAVLLFRMLTGKQLFEGDNVTAVLYHHVHSEPRKPSQVAPDIRAPRPLEMVILRCLEKDPSRRIPTMAELDRALGAAVDFSTSAPAVVDPHAATIASTEMPTSTSAPYAAAQPGVQQSDPAAETAFLDNSGRAPAAADPPTPSTSAGRRPSGITTPGFGQQPHDVPSLSGLEQPVNQGGSVGVVVGAAAAGVLLAVACVLGVWWLLRAEPAASVQAEATVTPQVTVTKAVPASEAAPAATAPDQPSEEPAATDAPAESAPTPTEKPAVEAAPAMPAASATATAKPAAKPAEPATSEPAPAASKPATKKATAKKPAKKKPAKKPVTKPAPKTEPADKPVKKKPGFIRVRTGESGG
jgi:serine/threonine-protein kinase